MANCLNRKAINEVEELTKLKVKPFNSTWIEIRRAIEAISKKAGAPAAAPAAAPAETPPVEVAEPASAEAAPLPAEPAAEEAVAAAAPAAEPAQAETKPFAGPARAHIEGLDELGSTEAEVVQETSRGLASKHSDEIKRRRAKRQELMGTGKGVVGRLVAPGLEAYRPEGAAGEAAPADASELVPLRMVDEHLLAGTDLPVAKQLAANLEAFRAPAAAVAPIAPPPVAAPAAAPAPAPEPEPEPAPAPAKRAAPELPPVPAISFKPEEVKEVVPAAISDEEWAAMQADLELDPVVLWQATYASAGPVPAAQSWL
jgi:hypothetical protein